jgi:hypothetical protein
MTVRSYIEAMTDDEFDASLVRAAFASAAVHGWRKLSPMMAAREAGLDLARARLRFPNRLAILRRFGRLADAHALEAARPEAPTEPVKDRLFDLLLRRFDFLQMHRAGVIALLRHAPLEPCLSIWLAAATELSMGWMLEAAGISAYGLRGKLRRRGLMAVWAWGVRAWIKDESMDLSATMAAVDAALTRADQFATRFDRGPSHWDAAGPEDKSEEGGGPHAQTLPSEPPPEAADI